MRTHGDASFVTWEELTGGKVRLLATKLKGRPYFILEFCEERATGFKVSFYEIPVDTVPYIQEALQKVLESKA